MKLHQRNELVQWLVLRKFARCEAAGQIERAELDRESPVQYVHIAREHWAKLAGLRINSEVYRTPRRRVVERDRASNAERPQPTQSVRKVAETFAEKNSSLEQVWCIGADTLSP